MSDYGPEHGTTRWNVQVDRISRCLRMAADKTQMEALATMYVLDTEYSRSDG